MRTNANAVGSERTFICHAVADVHDAKDSRGRYGRTRVRSDVSDFQFLPRNVHPTEEARPPPLSLHPFPSRSNFHRLGRRPTVYPATIICHRHLSASVYTFVREAAIAPHAPCRFYFSINYTTVLHVL